MQCHARACNGWLIVNTCGLVLCQSPFLFCCCQLKPAHSVAELHRLLILLTCLHHTVDGPAIKQDGAMCITTFYAVHHCDVQLLAAVLSQAVVFLAASRLPGMQNCCLLQKLKWQFGAGAPTSWRLLIKVGHVLLTPTHESCNSSTCPLASSAGGRTLLGCPITLMLQ